MLLDMSFCQFDLATIAAALAAYAHDVILVEAAAGPQPAPQVGAVNGVVGAPDQDRMRRNHALLSAVGLMSWDGDNEGEGQGQARGADEMQMHMEVAQAHAETEALVAFGHCRDRVRALHVGLVTGAVGAQVRARHSGLGLGAVMVPPHPH